MATDDECSLLGAGNSSNGSGGGGKKGKKSPPPPPPEGVFVVILRGVLEEALGMRKGAVPRLQGVLEGEGKGGGGGAGRGVWWLGEGSVMLMNGRGIGGGETGDAGEHERACRLIETLNPKP